jgi:hypothetical protein
MSTTTISTKSKPVRTERTGRELLKQLGIGQFNITMIIPYLWIAPATTDPKSAQTILMVEKLQGILAGPLQAPVRVTGYLDLETAKALSKLVGDRWMSMPWAATIRAVVNARDNGLTMEEPMPDLYVPETTLAGIPGVPGLPDVPGGIITYGVAAYFIYRAIKKRR